MIWFCYWSYLCFEKIFSVHCLPVGRFFQYRLFQYRCLPVLSSGIVISSSTVLPSSIISSIIVFQYWQSLPVVSSSIGCLFQYSIVFRSAVSSSIVSSSYSSGWPSLPASSSSIGRLFQYCLVQCCLPVSVISSSIVSSGIVYFGFGVSHLLVGFGVSYCLKKVQRPIWNQFCLTKLLLYLLLIALPLY